MKTILLHGLGQMPSSWNETVKYMEEQKDIVILDLFALTKDKSMNYNELYNAFVEYCISLHEPLNLCGLSLGGILALQFTIEYPKVVNSLILIGARYNVPKTLFKIQNAVFKVMPNKSFTQMGIEKADFISLSKSMIDIDLENDLKSIQCRTLVICGEKDKANLKASQELQNKISNAEILIIENANHEVNLDNPQKLATSINSFVDQ